jgi:hypothetical protein
MAGRRRQLVGPQRDSQRPACLALPEKVVDGRGGLRHADRHRASIRYPAAHRQSTRLPVLGTARLTARRQPATGRRSLPAIPRGPLIGHAEGALGHVGPFRLAARQHGSLVRSPLVATCLRGFLLSRELAGGGASSQDPKDLEAHLVAYFDAGRG